MSSRASFLARPGRILALVFGVAFLVFAPSFQAGFAIDDTGQILQNRAVRELDIESIFTKGYWENVDLGGIAVAPGGELYRPLTTLSVACSYQLYGEQPLGYHVENVFFHAGASALATLLILTWTTNLTLAALTGLLFAVAPIHIEPVASIILRNELLAAIFGLAFLILHFKRRTVVAALTFLLALLCKESAIALPFVAALADHVFGKRGARTVLKTYVPAFVAVLIFLALRIAVIGAVTLDSQGTYFRDENTLTVWLTMSTFAFEHYLLASLLGTPLVFDFYPESFANANAAAPLAWLALVFWLVLGFGSLTLALRKRSHAAAGITCALLLIGPTANLLLRTGIIGASRLMYLPYLGIAFALAVLAHTIRGKLHGRVPPLVLPTLALLILMAYVFQTERKLRVWNFPYRLYQDVLAHAPRNALMLGSLGDIAFAASFDETRSTLPPEARDKTSEELRTEAFESFLLALEVSSTYWNRFLRHFANLASTREQELRVLRALDSAMREALPDYTVAPMPQSLAQGPLRRLSPNETAWLMQWSTALQSHRMSPSDARSLASNPDPQSQLLQGELLARLARLWPAILQIQSERPHLNQLIRTARQNPTPDQKRTLLLSIDRLLKLQNFVAKELRDQEQAIRVPLVQQATVGIYGPVYMGRANAMTNRLRNLRNQL